MNKILIAILLFSITNLVIAIELEKVDKDKEGYETGTVKDDDGKSIGTYTKGKEDEYLYIKMENGDAAYFDEKHSTYMKKTGDKSQDNYNLNTGEKLGGHKSENGVTTIYDNNDNKLSTYMSGKVTDVQDGDTITVDTGNEKHQVRLSDIDAPELSQKGGRSSRNYTKSKVENKNVTVHLDNENQEDKYGRKVGRVYTEDGEDVNKDIVRQGQAYHTDKFSNDPEISTAQDKAKKEKKGIWKDDNAEKPWNYRNN